MQSARLLAVAAIALGVAAFAGTASAEGTVVRERTVTTVPNRPLIWSGVFTLGISYGISAVVGATSNTDADRYLFIPVAGPWIDFASRAGCPGTGSCAGETAAKVGLVIDGIFQGIGAISIVSGFLWRRQVVVRDTAAIHVMPYTGAHGSGLMLTGTF